MKRTFLLLMAGLLLAGCGAVPTLQDSYDLPTLTPLPSRTADPASLTIPGGADGVGLAFFKAWENGDLVGMYSLLAPQMQALVEQSAFIARYEEAMTTAGVRTVHIQPLSALQEGDRASMTVRVTWETAVVGPIVRDHPVDLVYRDNRWGVNWHEGLILPELAGGNRLNMTYRVPARANIYDRDGDALANQGTAIALGVVPGRIVDEDGLLATVAPLLNSTPDALRERYANAQPDWYVHLGDITSEMMQANYAVLAPFLEAGLTTGNRLTRIYADETVAPHVLGFVGAIPGEQLADYQARGYNGDEQVGRAAVEAWGEDYLSGTAGGTLTVVRGSGEYVTTIAESEPRQARSLFLTLDREFQTAVNEAVNEALASYPDASNGAAVVLDVNSGDVLAMVSVPGFDPTIFDSGRPAASGELEALLNDSRRPLVNRVTQGEYPAGSVYKIVTFTAGMNSGLFTPQTRYNSIGTWNRLGDALIKTDWRTGGHGNISLAHALVVSCNSCFYEVGYQVDELDPWLAPNTARAFGFGAATGIEGVPEASGAVPDPEWKVATIGEGWVRGDAVNAAIGQGFVLVTPLQIANMMAAIANGGTLPQPTLVDRIGAGGGAPEELWPRASIGQIPVTAEILTVLRERLRLVTTDPNGTAVDKFATLRVPVAGKTGTAETVPGQPAHAWFAGYAPAAPYTLADGRVIDQPEIAIAVLVENGGEGSAVSAPIFRRIVELYYGITPLTPFPWAGQSG